MSLPPLQQLASELASLEAALDCRDLDRAQTIMSSYDRELRDYIERAGNTVPMDGLRTLLRMQNELLTTMHELRESLGREARDAQRAGHASRAYASVGVAL
ncbi:hypothetical protein [Luteimonas sp. YGD11-2]|uniref:hypothetical protein n=1 Tax=Luteimonas sp. YGD11-2 TaxID=2508168 RepID=UPI00100ABA89|nr:hypothetical protein [Luteimonas sp. YGD11-2]